MGAVAYVQALSTSLSDVGIANTTAEQVSQVEVVVHTYAPPQLPTTNGTAGTIPRHH